MNLLPILVHSGFLLHGLALTILVSGIGLFIGLIGGMVLAAARLSSFAAGRAAGGLYVDFFRSTPFLSQVFWFFYAFPVLTGLNFDALTTGCVALGMYEAAYLGEVFRTGILSVPRGQAEAAYAEGMTRAQVARLIVLPQAIRTMLPPLGSSFVSLIKDSSILSAIGVAELTFQGNAVATATFRPLETLTVVALMYALVTYPLTLVVNVLHRRSVRVTSGAA